MNYSKYYRSDLKIYTIFESPQFCKTPILRMGIKILYNNNNNNNNIIINNKNNNNKTNRFIHIGISC